jgi:ribonuclease P protein component
MLNKTHRFHGYNSLRYVYQHGQTARDPNLTVRYCINNKRRNYRVAVVVSKKVDKSAVKRNRIRRRLYQFVSLNASKINKPYDIVLNVVSEEIAGMPALQLKEVLVKLFGQTDIFEPSPSTSQRGIVNKKEV